ncbi:hypothetical protein L9F63_002272, partial [Diploptera punctata]
NIPPNKFGVQPYTSFSITFLSSNRWDVVYNLSPTLRSYCSQRGRWQNYARFPLKMNFLYKIGFGPDIKHK